LPERVVVTMRAGLLMRNSMRVVLSLLLALPAAIFMPATALAADEAHGVLVRTIETSEWPAPSPDPSAIAYDASHDRLLTFDGEVDEIPALFQGANAFETTLLGQPERTFSTLAWTSEPVGADFHPDTGHLFVSTDAGDKVFEVDPGTDGLVGTADDIRTSWLTGGFGITDPESIAVDPGATSGGADDRIFIGGGGAGAVFVISPGPDGVFQGPSSDDVATSWDTDVLGIPDIESIEYDEATGHLYLIGVEATADIIETTAAGALVGVIDISSANAFRPAGITLAPASGNPAEMNLYLVDRGVDNATDPDENDGRIFEIDLVAGPAPNLVGNSSFEIDHDGDGLPDDWSERAEMTRSSALAHSGTFSARHASSADVGYTVSQDANPITAGQAYAFSAWTNIPATSDSFTFRHRIQWRDAANDTIRTDTIATFTGQTSGWVQTATELTAPAGAVTARLQANVGSLNALVYVDDVRLGSSGLSNQGPTATGDAVSTAEDTSVTIDVLANDTDPDLDILDVTALSNPPKGSAAINGNDTITYTPDGNANGSDSFSYTISDGHGGTDTATVGVTVTPVNDPPTVSDPADRTNVEGATVSLQIAASDVDAGDMLAYTATPLPPGLSIDADTGLITGTIEAGASAGSPYAVDATVTDSATASATAWFTWTVQPASGAPAAPTGLSGVVTVVGIDLDWANSPEPSVVGFNVYRSTAVDGPFSKLNGALLTTSAYSDATAPIGQTAFYRVTAVDTTDQESDPAATSLTRRVGFVASRTATIKTGTTIQIVKPTGTASGDMMLAALTVSGTVAITPPAGWSQVVSTANGTALTQTTFTKIAGASEPASYSWTLAAARPTSGAIVVYRGATAIDVFGSQTIANNKSIRAPSVTTTVGDGMLVGFFGIAANATMTPDPQMREVADIVITGGGLKAALEVADDVLGAAGATGLRTAVATKGGPNIGQVIALRP
jgi:hypothetical protein